MKTSDILNEEDAEAKAQREHEMQKLRRYSNIFIIKTNRWIHRMSDFEFNVLWVGIVWLLSKTEDTFLGKLAVVLIVVFIATGTTLFSRHFL